MRKLSIDIVKRPDWPMDDGRAWHAAVVGGGLFEEIEGRLARYSEQRLKVLADAYGRWIGYLKTSITDGALSSGLAHVEDADALSGFLQELQAVAPCTARGYLTDLLTVCNGLRPNASFTLLHRAVRHSWRTAKPASSKIERMVPARDLFQLGFKLMHEAATLSTPLKRAGRYRDGLMIAMLISAPVRIESFVAMKIDEQLVWDGTRYRLCFRPAQVKTRRYLEFPLPLELNDPIRTWLEAHRPVCLAREGRWHRNDGGAALWISESGASFARASHVRERIQRMTLTRLNRRINPHLFRDIAATSIASEIPQDVGITKIVLGHSDLRSGQRFYNQARSIGAATKLQDVLAGFRDAAMGKERI